MKTYINILLTITFLTLMSGTTFGTTKISARSGLFHTASTWSDNAAPAAGDDIVILQGHGVGNASGTIGKLTVEGSLGLYSGTKLTVQGDLTVKETGSIIHPSSGSLNLLGEKLVNDGKITPYAFFNAGIKQTISGSGKWSGGGEFGGSETKTIENMTVTAGQWLVNGVVEVEKKWLFIDAGIRKSATGNVRSMEIGGLSFGAVEFQGTGFLASDESTGNLFTAYTVISDGVRNCLSGSISSAPLIIEEGALLTTPTSQTYFGLRGSVNVNPGGTLNGRSIYFSGITLNNRGLINSGSFTFNRQDDQTILGDGQWKSQGVYFKGSGTRSLENSITMDVGSFVLDSSLNLNEHTLTFNKGSFDKNKTAKIEGAGRIVFNGAGFLASDESTGNLFSSPIDIAGGVRSLPASSGFSGKITVYEEATLNVYPNKTLYAKNDVEVKPGGSITNAGLSFRGTNFINDGNVTSFFVYFYEGEHSLSGAGKFSGNTIYLQTGSNTTLKSDHQVPNLTLQNAQFDISGKTLKIAGALSVDAASAMTTTDSTIEYNADNVAQIVATKIDYYYLTINNPRGVSLRYAEKVKNNLKLENGIFTVGDKLLAVCGQTIEVNGSLDGTLAPGICLPTNTNAVR